MKKTAEEAAEKWVFETNGHKWSNNDNTAGDNFASFIAGAKWQKEQDKSTDGEWLSPVPTERAWQEEKLVEIFGHYLTASPKWQYMNGLIQNSLDAKQMYSEEEVIQIVLDLRFKVELYSTREEINEWFEQFFKKK
jgi:hypothetical protein